VTASVNSTRQRSFETRFRELAAPKTNPGSSRHTAEKVKNWRLLVREETLAA
jgi:hypothetical protein